MRVEPFRIDLFWTWKNTYIRVKELDVITYPFKTSMAV